MRAFIIFVFLPAILVAPFVWTSLAVDQRGITILGSVYSKRESVRMRDNSWKRSSQVTIQYEVPETSSAGFLGVILPPAEYDSYRIGQHVSLHYLRKSDVPDFPTSRVLREMHLLPTVRLANQRAFSFLDQKVPATWLMAGAAALAVVVVLVIWRLIWRSTFWWPMGFTILAVVAVAVFFEFPRPTQQPRTDLQQADGRVKYVNHITYLLRTQESRGIETKQPIDVVEVEFQPAGNSDPVLAVDLIDTNSVRGLKDGTPVRVVYEAKSPRVAHLVGATRNFYAMNFQGALEQEAIELSVLGILVVSCVVLPRMWKRRRLAKGLERTL